MSRLILLLLLLPGVAYAQTPRAEIGLPLSGVRETAFGGNPVGAGGRVTIHTFQLTDAGSRSHRYRLAGALETSRFHVASAAVYERDF